MQASGGKYSGRATQKVGGREADSYGQVPEIVSAGPVSQCRASAGTRTEESPRGPKRRDPSIWASPERLEKKKS